MAEPSAVSQSPSVSSSSSGAEPAAPGGGSPGACPALGAKSCSSSCADSFVSSSSSQPVSLFTTSQEALSCLCSGEAPSEMTTSSFITTSEICYTDLTTRPGEKSKVLASQPVLVKEGKDCLTLLDGKEIGKPQETSRDVSESPISIETGICANRPSIPASFPEHPDFLSKEVGRMGIQNDQESKNQNEVPCQDDKIAVGAADRFSLLSAQKLPTEMSKAEGICTHTLSPSQVSGDDVIERDSPESPFEVIIDKAAFDKEFKDSYKSTNNFGRWTVPNTDEESSAEITETDDKVFPLRSREAGRYPASTLLPRQFSHTTAALEEVSRCVNDMHNFTNEILTWDLVPQVKQQYDKANFITKPTGLDMGECNSEIPVVNLKTNTHQKISVGLVNGNNSIAKSTSDWAEASFPHENTTPVCLDSREEVSSTKDTQDYVQKQADILSESLGSPFQKCVSLGPAVTTASVALSDDHLKDEMKWHSAVLGEVTEADSSGESDDTVIEDITENVQFEKNKIPTEKPVPIPSAIIKTGERDMEEIPSYNTENKISKKFEGSVTNSEPQEVQPGIPRSPVGQVAQSGVSNTSIIAEEKRQPKSMSDTAPERPVVTEGDEIEFSTTGITSAYLQSSCEEDSKDKDDSSPEELIAAFTETRANTSMVREEGNAFEALSEKKTDFRTMVDVEVLHESELGSSDVKDLKSKYIEQSKETSRNELHDFPTQGTRVASLDLDQEQLTIKALKELGERQVKESVSLEDKVTFPSDGAFKQTVAFPPDSSWPQRSHDLPEHKNVNTESEPGNSEKPSTIKESTQGDVVPSLSKTELVNKPVLARLLTDVSVHDLIFWRDVKKTGFVFGTTLIVLLSLAAFSVISVVSYLILALLSVTISFRVYKSVIQAVQKSEEGHPFKAYLDVDITLSSEAFHNYVNAAMVHVNRALKLIIRLFLVEDLVDSLKLAVFMWLMTYVGAVFNGITLLILAELLVFSVPVVYEKYKTQIDHYVGIARDQTKSIVEKIQAKLPGIAKKKAE